MDPIRIRLAKETFKFSAAHFTLFSAKEAERMHGHNYQARVDIELSGLDGHGMGFEFNSLKPIIKAAVDLWDERVLLPSANAHLKIHEEAVRGEAHWVADFHTRSYRFPKGDVVLLPTTNVTSEELARLLAVSIADAWRSRTLSDIDLQKRVLSLTVTVEETAGQEASFTLRSPLSDLA